MTAVPESASFRVVAYTMDPPYGKGKPGYVSQSTQSTSGDIMFTDDLWMALALTREDMGRWLPNMKQRTKNTLFTHEAAVMLADYEVLSHRK